jgi:hypothetical protein
MTMACLGIVMLVFGGVPTHVVDVPRSKLARYSPEQVKWAKACAARHGIRYRIVER